MASLQPPIVVRESRWKTGLGTLLMVVVGFWTIDGGAWRAAAAKDPWLYLFAAAFVVAVVWSALETILPSTLVLEPAGFTIRQFWRTRRVAWSDASNFRVRFSRSGRYVTYDRPGASVLFGSRQLPINWSMSPPDLARLMNECRTRWSVGAPAAPPQPLATAPQPREPTVI